MEKVTQNKRRIKGLKRLTALLITVTSIINLVGCGPKVDPSKSSVDMTIEDNEYSGLRSSSEYYRADQAINKAGKLLFKEDIKGEVLATESPLDYEDAEKNKALDLIYYCAVNFDKKRCGSSDNKRDFVDAAVNQFYINDNAVDSMVNYLFGLKDAGIITIDTIKVVMTNVAISDILDEATKRELDSENIEEFKSLALSTLNKSQAVDDGTRPIFNEYVQNVYDKQIGTIYFDKKILTEEDLARLIDYMEQMKKFNDSVQLGKTCEQIEAELKAEEEKKSQERSGSGNSGGGSASIGNSGSLVADGSVSSTEASTEADVKTNSILSINGSEKTSSNKSSSKNNDADDDEIVEDTQISIKVDGSLQKCYLSIMKYYRGGAAERQVNKYNEKHDIKYDLNINDEYKELCVVRFKIKAGSNVDSSGTYIPVARIKDTSGSNLETYPIIGRIMQLDDYSNSGKERTYDLVFEVPKDVKNFIVMFGENTGKTYKFKTASLSD